LAAAYREGDLRRIFHILNHHLDAVVLDPIVRRRIDPVGDSHDLRIARRSGKNLDFA